LLFGVQPWDPESLAASITGALAVAVLAALIPALRAAMLNPADVLRRQ
jgi:ABC-type lipoprotein release transport system permease subunit